LFTHESSRWREFFVWQKIIYKGEDDMAGAGERGGALLDRGAEEQHDTGEDVAPTDTGATKPPYGGQEQVPGRPDLVGEAARLATVGAFERDSGDFGWGAEAILRPVDYAASDNGMGL
jgi:hypothetical protein